MTALPSVRPDEAAELPPLVPGSFLLGSAVEMRRDVIGLCERSFARYGDVVRFAVGPPGVRFGLYLLFHPDAAHRVFAAGAANYRKDNPFYAEVRNGFGNGLLTSQDDDWQRQKRFLQPLFTVKRVTGYAGAMADEAQRLAGRWRSKPAGVVDLHAEMTALTLQVVCRVLFGADAEQVLPALRRSFSPLGEAVRRRGFAPVRLPLAWPTPVNRQLTRSRAEMFGACDDIIARRRAAGPAAGSGPGPDDMVGLLLTARDSGAALTDTEVREQVLIFLLAGHETTSTALTFTLHLLGRHPEVQRRVRAEVAAVLGDRAPTAEDAAALTYTTMVLKEAMRLYPSAPFTGRRAVEADEIGGYRIPAGSDVVLATWIIHRHPEFWADPERFDPERFTAEQEKTRHRYAWCPFGGGPRACIGQHFSMLESVIILATLVRDFEFAAPPTDPAYTNHITLRPTHGVPSNVTPIAS
jgi:cytochrome P450